MKLFKNKMMSWWDIGLIKISLLFIGIAIGAYWPKTFVDFGPLFILFGLLIGLYSFYSWLKN